MTFLACLLSILLFFTGSNDISIVFAGDAMQHDRQIAVAKNGAGYDYSRCFEYLKPYISSADYSVVNFECTLGGTPYKGYPCFSAPDEYALSLKEAGFDLFLHANNHCLDRRDAGLVRTLNKLDEFKIPHIGTYRNTKERQQAISYIVDIMGCKVAFLNYTYGTNGITIQKDVCVNYINEEQIKTDLAFVRTKNPDMIAVCIHWGEEYKLLQNKEQEKLANLLVDEGVDMVIGSHPHVIQPMEMRYSEKYKKNVLVVYSLGNLISAMRTTDTRGGAMVRVSISKDNGKAKLKEASYKLFFVQQPKMPGDNYVLIPYGRTDLLRRDTQNDYDRFMKNALNIFNKHNKNVEQDKSIPILGIEIPMVEFCDTL